MSVLSNFSKIVELSKKCVLMLIDDKFIFLRRTLYFILDIHIINYLCIRIHDMFSEIKINIYNNDKLIIILLSLILMFQTLALVNRIINMWIVSHKLGEHIYNYCALYIYGRFKYEITTTLSDFQIFEIFSYICIYQPNQKNIVLKFDRNLNIKSLTYNDIYTIEYNGLLIINKITNQTSKYNQILNKIFLPEITDIILRYLFNFDN